MKSNNHALATKVVLAYVRDDVSARDIAREFGISRQLVNMFCARAGATRWDSGRMNAYLRRVFGCDLAEYRALTGTEWDGSNPGDAYRNQRDRARMRGIEWAITFPEWWRIWQESGKWAQRGKLGHNYVMARNGDAGPYAVGNVYICTSSQNISDWHATRGQ